MSVLLQISDTHFDTEQPQPVSVLAAAPLLRYGWDITVVEVSVASGEFRSRP